MKNIKRKHAVIFLLIALLVIILSLFANSIVLSISSDAPRLRRVNTDNFLRTSRTFSYVTLNIRQDMFETFFVRGWAFADADYQEGKTVDLVLRGINNDRFYSAPTILRIHGWLQRYFVDTDIRLPGNLNNFVGEFSALPLPDDVYEIYLYIKENENEAGWSRPGLRFEVRGNRLYHFNPNVQNFTGVPFFDIFTSYSIDSIGINNNSLYFHGWFASHGYDTLFQDVWIEMTDSNAETLTFRTNSIIRDDVVEHFGDPLLSHAGFNVEIPMEYLSDWDEFTVMLIVNNNGNLARHEASAVFNLDALRQ